MESLHPAPPMLGSTPLEQARTQELDRLAELGIMMEMAAFIHHMHPFFAHLGPQSEAGGKLASNIYYDKLAIMDAEIGSNDFVVGDRPSVADCTLFAALDCAVKFELTIPDKLSNILRWRKAFAARPSASA